MRPLPARPLPRRAVRNSRSSSRPARCSTPAGWRTTRDVVANSPRTASCGATRPTCSNGSATRSLCSPRCSPRRWLRPHSCRPPSRAPPTAAGCASRSVRRRARHPLRTTGRSALTPSYYFQEFIDGVPMSALFVSDRRGDVLLGVTEQLDRRTVAARRAVRATAGTSARSTCRAAAMRRSHRVGVQRSRRMPVSAAVWGIDFILDADDQPFPVEVNPRYTASARGARTRDGYGRDARSTRLRSAGREAPAGRRLVATRVVVGKAIYYAPHRLTFPASGPWDADLAGAVRPVAAARLRRHPGPGRGDRTGLAGAHVLRDGRHPPSAASGYNHGRRNSTASSPRSDAP